MSQITRAVAAALLIAAAAAGPASAAWPGLNGRISVTQDPRTKDVFAFARDGSSTQLTFTGNNEEQSSWAPDGRRIAFKRSDEVFVRDVTTDAAPARLTVKAVSTENNTQPGWSPDGRSIVFRSNRADPSQNVADIWIMDADGGNERPLLVQEGDQRYPALSPDGRHLAYMSRSDGGTADIWLARADGTGARLVYDSGFADSAPTWSPDGTKLAFQTQRLPDAVDGDVFVLDLRRGTVRQLTSDPPEAPVHDEGPAFSPDGTMIAFTSERSDPQGDIWIMRADGSQPRQLTTDPVLDESPDWQPIPLPGGFGDRWPARACGDLSLLPGGIASLAAVRLTCRTARHVAERWSADESRPRRFTCTVTPHTFDQQLVDCRHRGGRKAVASVRRAQ